MLRLEARRSGGGDRIDREAEGRVTPEDRAAAAARARQFREDESFVLGTTREEVAAQIVAMGRTRRGEVDAGRAPQQPVRRELSQDERTATVNAIHAAAAKARGEKP